MKQRYGPVPCRAAHDKRLSALDFRLLTIVAGHDCFGAYGKGCTAGQERLAIIVGAARKSVARSITRLIEFNYIASESNPDDRRRRSYRVIYTKADHNIFEVDASTIANSSIAQAVPTEQIPDHLPADIMSPDWKNSVTETLGSVTRSAPIGNRRLSVNHCNHSDTCTLIEDSKYKSGNRTHIIESSVRGSKGSLVGIGQNSHQSTADPKSLSVSLTDEFSSICNAWTNFSGTHPVFSLSDQKAVHRSIERHSTDFLLGIIARARTSPFLKGERGDWNGMPIKWLWNETRLAEIERGDYDTKSHRKTYRQSSRTVADIRELLDES